MSGEPEDRRDRNEIAKAPLTVADEDSIKASLICNSGVNDQSTR